MENKNLLIALVLMLAVWVGFTVLFPPVPQPARETTVPADDSSLPARPESVEEKKVRETVRAPIPESIDRQEAVAGREVVVENEVFRAVLSNVGGRLKSFELKKYRTDPGEESATFFLVQPGPDRLATLRTTGLEGWELAPDTIFNISAEEQNIRLAPGEKKEISFSRRLPSGLIVEKTYLFQGGQSYDFGLEIRITNAGEMTQKGILALTLLRPWDEGEKGSMYEFVGPATMVGEDVNREDIEDLGKETPVYSQQVVWTGFEKKYFLTALVPFSGAAGKVRIEKADGNILNIVETPYSTLAPGEAVTFEFLNYFGPKDLDILKEVNYQLAEAVDFGFFSPISLPLLHVLKFFYTFLGNYGLSIILLTVIIKLLFWPLTHKSYASMKSMQRLQPEMQKIREKHGKDKERLNRELMELYKKHRVNPLGGCLPMLVQIPVFFALYKVLMETIDLRHAPFYFWITDLSAKDPYYITPVIMGASMFVQQKMTPTTMDPKQAKLFMLMPLIFTFMFLNFPSGLVIYWLVNNLLTIGQQALINRKR